MTKNLNLIAVLLGILCAAPSPVSQQPGSLYVIDDKTFAAPAASYTVTIPAGCTHLRFVSSVQTSNSTYADFLARPNNDSGGSNYTYWLLQMTTLTGTISTSGIDGKASGTTSGLFAITDATLYFGGVAETSQHSWVSTTQFYWDGVSGAAMETKVGLWSSGAAATSIVYLCTTGNISTGSRIITYGIR